MSSRRRHPHKGGPTPTTEPKDRPGVVQFSVSEVAQFSMSLDRGVDVGLHDRVAPSGGHHQIHYGAKAVGELFLKSEVSVDQLSGLERLEFNQ